MLKSSGMVIVLRDINAHVLFLNARPRGRKMYSRVTYTVRINHNLAVKAAEIAPWRFSLMIPQFLEICEDLRFTTTLRHYDRNNERMIFEKLDRITASLRRMLPVDVYRDIVRDIGGMPLTSFRIL